MGALKKKLHGQHVYTKNKAEVVRIVRFIDSYIDIVKDARRETVDCAFVLERVRNFVLTGKPEIKNND